MINSHYIPQLILRHFCQDNKILYYDIDEKKLEARNTKSIFAEPGYYPENIEHDLCDKIERGFANILNTKILPQRNEIVLSREELTIVKKYLIIASYRYRLNEKKLNEDGVDLKSVQDAEIANFTKRLSKILSCDDENDFIRLRNKYFTSIATLLCKGKFDADNFSLGKGVNDILGSYLGFLCTDYCKEDYVVTDLGYCCYFGQYAFKKLNAMIDSICGGNKSIELFSIALSCSPVDYYVFPVANNMAIICWSPFLQLYDRNTICNIVNATVNEHIGFGSKDTISSPKVQEINGKRTYTYSVKQITNSDLHHLNYLLLEETDKYIAFADYNKIKPSVEYAEKQTQKKRDFSALLKL